MTRTATPREQAAEQRTNLALALLDEVLAELQRTLQRIEDKRQRGFPSDG